MRHGCAGNHAQGQSGARVYTGPFPPVDCMWVPLGTAVRIRRTRFIAIHRKTSLAQTIAAEIIVTPWLWDHYCHATSPSPRAYIGTCCFGRRDLTDSVKYYPSDLQGKQYSVNTARAAHKHGKARPVGHEPGTGIRCITCIPGYDAISGIISEPAPMALRFAAAATCVHLWFHKSLMFEPPDFHDGGIRTGRNGQRLMSWVPEGGKSFGGRGQRGGSL